MRTCTVVANENSQNDGAPARVFQVAIEAKLVFRHKFKFFEDSIAVLQTHMQGGVHLRFIAMFEWVSELSGLSGTMAELIN